MGRASDPVYLVTTDDYAGWGSYSDRATMLCAARGGRLQRVAAKSPNGLEIRPAQTHAEPANRIGAHRAGVTREMRPWPP